MRDEAAAIAGVAATGAHRLGFTDANAVPTVGAAECVGIADKLAATLIVAAGCAMGLEAASIVGVAAAGAHVLGFVDANAVPRGVATERISGADGVAARGVVAGFDRVNHEAASGARAPAGGANRCGFIGANVVPLVVAAEWVDSADRNAALRDVASRRRVSDQAIAAGPADGLGMDVSGEPECGHNEH